MQYGDGGASDGRIRYTAIAAHDVMRDFVGVCYRVERLTGDGKPQASIWEGYVDRAADPEVFREAYRIMLEHFNSARSKPSGD